MKDEGNVVEAFVILHPSAFILWLLVQIRNPQSTIRNRRGRVA